MWARPCSAATSRRSWCASSPRGAGARLFLSGGRWEAREALQSWLTLRPRELWAERPLVPGLSATWHRCHHSPSQAHRAEQAAAAAEVNYLPLWDQSGVRAALADLLAFLASFYFSPGLHRNDLLMAPLLFHSLVEKDASLWSEPTFCCNAVRADRLQHRSATCFELGCRHSYCFPRLVQTPANTSWPNVSSDPNLSPGARLRSLQTLTLFELDPGDQIAPNITCYFRTVAVDRTLGLQLSGMLVGFFFFFSSRTAAVEFTEKAQSLTHTQQGKRSLIQLVKIRRSTLHIYTRSGRSDVCTCAHQTFLRGFYSRA